MAPALDTAKTILVKVRAKRRLRYSGRGAQFVNGAPDEMKLGTTILLLGLYNSVENLIALLFLSIVETILNQHLPNPMPNSERPWESS